MRNDLINGFLAVFANAATVVWAAERGFEVLTSVMPVILFLLGKLIDFYVRLYFVKRAENKKLEEVKELNG